jgi:hypothetical protein
MNVLLEFFNKLFLTEGASVASVTDAIKGRYMVTINYKGDPRHGVAPGIRTIQVYVYGLTQAGNPCIRAYQPYGDTASKVPAWKMFRLDRIISWKPTYGLFNKPAPLFNPNGDKSMSVVYDIVNFNTPTNKNNVDGPKQKQQFKQVGTLDDFEKIQADREREKRNKVSGEKEINRPKLVKPLQNTKLPEPVVGKEKEPIKKEPVPTEVEKPEEVTPETIDSVEEPTIQTQGDKELQKFKDLNKRLDNATIMDLSGRRTGNK